MQIEWSRLLTILQQIEDVVQRCQEEHLDAFTMLFKQFQNHVFDVADAIMREDTVAEDVVQDTSLIVFQKINTVQRGSTFKT